MGRFRHITILAVVLLLTMSACRRERDAVPSIRVDSAPTQRGLALTVSGQNWQPGSQVIIGFAASETQSRESEAVTSALTDASGGFVALFLLPSDPRWLSLPEIWIVAHSRDWTKVAMAKVRNPQQPTATPLPRATSPAIPTAEGSAYLLGYVEEVLTDSRAIQVRPVEGRARTIVGLETATIVYAGQSLQWNDIRANDLIEASGQLNSEGHLIAATIRILTRSQTAVTPTPMPTPTRPPVVWQGEYYSNTTFSGRPLLMRNDPVIDFQWQADSPAPGLPVDNFAVRWTGTWPFEEGVYRFYAQVDDGVRLALDGHWIIDRWHESAGMLYTADAYVSQGLHTLVVEYFDGRGNALAKVWWEYRGLDARPSYADWKAEYYGNKDLSGRPFLVLNERTLGFDWGSGSPATGMPSDNFSVRWTRTVNLEAGVYVFYATADDGVRLWVDEILLIDRWQDTAVQTHSAERYLAKGNHTIRVEYYEHTGEAVIRVWWELLATTPTPTALPAETSEPTPTLTPVQGTDAAQPTPQATATSTGASSSST